MSRKFVFASSQFLQNGAAVLTAPPITMACWFNANSQGHWGFMSLATSGSSNNRFALSCDTTFHIEAVTRTSSNSIAATTTTYIPRVWNHACAVFAATNSRSSYLNGAGKVTDTGSKAPSAPNRTTIGDDVTGASLLFDGSMADAAIWNVALTDGEVLALVRGTKPTQVRPMSLVAYWPLNNRLSPEPDILHQAKNNMLLTAGPIASPDKPLVLNRKRGRRIFGAQPAATYQYTYGQAQYNTNLRM